MNRIFTLIVAFIFAGSTAFSQVIGLPNGLTEEEKLLMPSYLQNASQRSSQGFNVPPSSPIRAMAEWEEIDAIMITWTSYTATLKEIVRYAQLESKVYIICSDSNTVKSNLQQSPNPVTISSNVKYLLTPFNTVWARDYGQWNVYTHDVDSLLLIDWTYNRPRPQDDAVPTKIASYTGLPLYQMTQAPYALTHTGGNYMVDGFGTSFHSKLTLNENTSLTQTQIENLEKEFLGITRPIFMNTLPYDGIHHIDMHMKLLDEETLLVGEYPQGVADGPQIEANLQYVLSNYNSVFGTPYKVVRVPMPPMTNGTYPDNNGDYLTYANAVFINKTILVTSYRAQYDTTAFRIFKESLPGYKVIGIDCNQIIAASGALHCITKEVGSYDPLLISHQQLHNTTNTTIPYTVNALVQHRSGIQNATLYWTTDTAQGFQSVSMTLTNVANNTWSGDIPAKPVGTRIYYYVHAQSNSGKQQVRPLPAPKGFWKFDVIGASAIKTISANEFKMDAAFPNPSKGITCIPLKSNVSESAKIYLTDMLGRNVRTIFEGTIPVGESKYFINTYDMEAGVYFITIEGESHKNVQKLVVR